MTLESKDYVANERDIEALVTDLLAHSQGMVAGRSTYLKALIATTQHELGEAPRQRSAKTSGKLTDDEIAGQLAALEKTHERFYAVVMKTAGDKLPPGKEKARELNRRTNFARTSVSAVRVWIRAGHDLTGLAAARVTKAALLIRRPARQRAVSPKRLHNRVTRYAERLVSEVRIYLRADRDAAVADLQALIGRLVKLTGAGAPTRNVKKAIAERRPFRTGSATFVPMQGSVQ